MIELLKKYIFEKNILILGYGREGRSTYRRINEAGGFKSVTIADKNNITDNFTENVSLICGDEYQKTLNNYDIVFKSPGVVLEKPYETYSCYITSQTEIFMEKYSSQIIGITGTKGKSTTTTLIYHILSENKKDCVLTGNIGIPSFDVIDDITPETKIVFEMSCHQLENIRFSPKTALFLNLFEEHLDHYGTFEKYTLAKENIYRHQGKDDTLYCNMDITPSKEKCSSQIVTLSLTDNRADVFADDNSIVLNGNRFDIAYENSLLAGKHNHYNIAVAFAVCHKLGLSPENIINAVYTYKPLPHRLEFVGEYDGVKYYDDSISTMCESAIQAVNSINDADTLIAGGMDRGIDYTDLIKFFSDCKLSNIILMSDSGRRIYDEIQQTYGGSEFISKIILVNKLEDAVETAKKVTAKGKSCIMSPAAASYNEFKNFEERGDVFKGLVKGL